MAVVGDVALAPGFMLVQNAEPDTLLRDRMTRLRQHRTLLERALQPSGRALSAEPPEPRVRTLEAPEPTPAPAQQAQAQVSCEAAAEVVANYGFSDVRAADCASDPYRFSATRDGTDYSIGINAASGEIAQVSRE